MIGIVVVSHSPRLAQAALELALAMVPGKRPAIALAAGADGDVIGTDASRVAAAIEEVSSPEGVLVVSDLGSATMSAELALELIDSSSTRVVLSDAPFVEGLIAAVVCAAGGATLADVDREASTALRAKRAQLAAAPPSPHTIEHTDTRPRDGDSPSRYRTEQVDRGGVPTQADSPLRHRSETTTSGHVSGTFGSPSPSPSSPYRTEILPNAAGLHARPAAVIATKVAQSGEQVTITNASAGRGPVDAASTMLLLSLGARQGDSVEIRGVGESSSALVSELAELVAEGFGETADGAATPHSVVARAHHSAGDPIGVSAGRRAGRVLRMPDPITEPSATETVPRGDRAAAAARIVSATTSVVADLTRRAETAQAGHARDVLNATAQLTNDPVLVANSQRRVMVEGRTPQRAVWDAVSHLAAQLGSLGGVGAERVADLHDVRDRIVAQLTGEAQPGVPTSTDPFVLVATDLAPADTALLDPRVCLGIITAEGGPTSHTAILARALGIPAVVAAGAAASAAVLSPGTLVLLDGMTGEIVIDPTPELVASVATATATSTAVTGAGATGDGYSVPLLANIGGVSDVAVAVAARAQGVGLFRTEFCFLDRADAPRLDEQIAAYRAVFSGFAGQKVVVRTLDAGADKPLPFLASGHEPNPALGVRGYRTSWARPEVLDLQLTAIAAAAAAERADVWVMAPMIDTVAEAIEFARRARGQGVSTVGVMIETPAAALMSRELLDVVDFASLGTNDLTQYTMAADRMLGSLAALNDPWQPAVLRMIAAATGGAEQAGKPIGVCGEAAADPLLAVVLVGLGVATLSMAPRVIAPVAAVLGGASRAMCGDAAARALSATSSAAARAAVKKVMESR
ncbi:MAG: phosphoenolpyruvate--protein phosphotransferase [Candidatus Lumbricidophila eiseniae]|uniref:Phosphocarrier protein HPr n=1 Tax=Candidatus Lumbricidiphila eiseniae TaxID=1969409 RepID=A0A2A6FP29_9MICO|nr:MAG: phosphoenolpyruvate--protein phosphotransferase [Candidatus Lumbricidophila eiseniae]